MSRILRLTVAVLATVAGLLVAAPPARACSCVPRPPAEMVSDGEAAFVGTYLGREEPPPAAVRSSGDPVANHFDVEIVLEGELPEFVRVESALSGASCGLEYRPGQRVALVLHRKDGGWSSNLCSTMDPDEALAALGPGDAPLPGDEPPALDPGRDEPPPGAGGGIGGPAVAGGIVLGAVALAVLLWLVSRGPAAAR